MAQLKIHVRLSTTDEQSNIPACAFNARNYSHLPSANVKSPKEFRAAPSEDRCAHCEARYMVIRNKQRKAKGLPPVSTPFEGLE
jgi:hypothetical protein